ncbi:MAG: hypothetical protein KY439_05150 [Actinobacteria bacterium]|nr:hypothetical protein [Actinomycetota bacterium]
MLAGIGGEWVGAGDVARLIGEADRVVTF